MANYQIIRLKVRKDKFAGNALYSPVDFNRMIGTFIAIPLSTDDYMRNLTTFLEINEINTHNLHCIA